MIYTLGDIHSDINKIKVLSKSLLKDDILIILGDFGIPWFNVPTKEEKEKLKFLSNLHFKILVVDGNHENFSHINKYESINMFNNEVGVIAENVYHLRRGNIYNIQNFNCFVFGGGYSIDKYSRKLNISYWKEELPTYEEINKGIDTLEKVNYNVDYVFTHSAPLFMIDYFLKENMLSGGLYNLDQSLEKYFSFISKKLYFRSWFFGHYHIDSTKPIYLDGKCYVAQYNNCWNVDLITKFEY